MKHIPTSHDAVEIGGGVGLHYHYGTLGQLEHGVNYAEAYLRTIGNKPTSDRPLKAWPYEKGSAVKLFVLAGHRNMEGERALRRNSKPCGDRRRWRTTMARSLSNTASVAATKRPMAGSHSAPPDLTTPLAPNSASGRRCKAKSPATSPSPNSRTAVRR